MKKITNLFLILLPIIFLWLSRPWWISTFSLSQAREITPDNLLAAHSDSLGFAVFNNIKLSLPREAVSEAPDIPVILGAGSGNKWIQIDLATQRLYAIYDGKIVYDFLISSGKWNKTPTGRFRIWVKLKATKMEGGRKELGTYYYLPNVPYVMFFAGDDLPKAKGFGIHGTYWHDNFGQPMSHGCINMKTDEAKLLYYWADPDLLGEKSIFASEENPGTEVIIYGKPATD